jgi:hypothetical protein
VPCGIDYGVWLLAGLIRPCRRFVKWCGARTEKVITILGFVIWTSICWADHGSARHYAEDSSCDDVFRIFSLLERSEVQKDLRLSQEQIRTIKHIWHAQAKDIPGLPEARARHRKAMADSKLSEFDKNKERQASNAEVGRLIEAYQRKELLATLSTAQRKRLSELLIQMRGPIVLMDDAEIKARFRFREKQLIEMQKTVKYFEQDDRASLLAPSPDLSALIRRYGRQQFSARMPHQTEADLEEELKALFIVIRAMERERDASLLMDLTPAQLSLWSEIRGALLPIAWPQTSIKDYPFPDVSFGKAR